MTFKPEIKIILIQNSKQVEFVSYLPNGWQIHISLLASNFIIYKTRGEYYFVAKIL